MGGIYVNPIELYLFIFSIDQEKSKGLARKSEEYVPTLTPIINIKTKYFMVTPPKKKIASSTNNVVSEVLTDRT